MASRRVLVERTDPGFRVTIELYDDELLRRYAY
jgi:hypothetical protein